MPRPSNYSPLTIRLGGRPAPDGLAADLLEAVVDRRVGLPGAFHLRLVASGLRWLDDPALEVGETVEIAAGEPRLQVLLAGVIATLEADLDPDRPTLLVRGYDLSYRFHRESHHRSFTGLTDGQIAELLAFECGLTPQVTPTEVVHEYLPQHGQTNAEFLAGRGRAIGYGVWVDGGQLWFGPHPQADREVRLTWGRELRAFRPRRSVAAQVSEVEVRAWDRLTRRPIVARSSRPPGGPSLTAYAARRVVVAAPACDTIEQAERLAAAAAATAAAEEREAEGSCEFDLQLAPGMVVEVGGVGQRFGGPYRLTAVTHSWTAKQPMVTLFTAATLSRAGAVDRLPGPVVGVVTNDSDPLGLGRVRLRFPGLAELDESAWAPRLSSSGPHRIGDEVLVAFEYGDVGRPVVLGGLVGG
jgi:phage protein D